MSAIFGGIFQGIAQLQAGRLADVQGRFARDVALRNQQALERQAKAEREAAALEETRVARREKVVKAGQRAVIGKTGVGLAGATLSVLADAAFVFSLERNLALRRGLVRARQLIHRGKTIAAQGEFAKIQGTFTKRMSRFAAAGSILGAAGNAGLLSGIRTSITGLGTTTPVQTTRTAGLGAGFFSSPIYGGRVRV